MNIIKKNLFSSIDRRIIKPIESAPYSWGHWLVLILLSVAVRNLLESALEFPHIIGVATEPLALHTVEENFFHLPFFYLVVFFYLILILKACSGEPVAKVTKALATFSPIIILPPLLDSILFHFRGFRLLYPTEFQQLFVILVKSFAQPFGGPIHGVSPGMRLEVALGGLLGAGYVFIKRRNLLWALLALVLTLLGSAVIGGIPALVAQISGALLHIASPVIFNQTYYGSGLISSPVRKWGLIMLGLFTIQLVVWYLLHNRKSALRILKTVFSLGGWAYASVVVSGFFIALGMVGRAFTTLFTNIFDFFVPVTMVVVGLLFYAVQNLGRSVYGEGTADGRDAKEDRTLLLVCAVLLFFYSLVLGYSFLLLMLFALGLLWMYQVPPISLNRFFPVSTLFLSSIVIALSLAGFSSFGASRSIMIYPWRLFAWLLLAGIGAFAVKDFYDERPVFTIRTLLGSRVGRVVAGILMAAAIGLTPLVLQRAALWPYALVLAPVSFAVFMIFTKDPKPLVGCAMLFVVSVTVVLFRNPILNVPELEPQLKALGGFFDGERSLDIAGISSPQARVGLYRNAVRSYSVALDNNRGTIVHPASLRFRLGLAHLGLNQHQEALYEFDRVYGETRLSRYAHLARAPVGGALGLVYFKLNQEAEAKVIYDELAKGGWDLGKVYYQLGVLAKRNRQIDLAGRYFFYTVLLGEMIDEGLNRLASVWALQGNLEGAEGLYKRTLFYNPSYPPFYTALGNFYWDNRRFAAAESVYRQAIKVVSADPTLLNNLAMTIDAQGRWQAAIPFFVRAIQLNPGFIDAYLNLAVVFERVGLVDRARRVLAEVLRFEPGNSAAQQILSRINRKPTEGGSS